MRSLSRNASRRYSCAGFTLLEVIITTLLASVVLVALWSLSDIYLKMFASGKRKIEETQLVRSLTAQLAKDVSQVIQLPDDAPALTTTIATRFPSRAPSSSLSTVTATGFATQNSVVPSLTTNSALAPRGQTDPTQQISAVVPQTQVSVTRKSNQLIPRFGLFGTKQALRLIVLQAEPRTTRSPSSLEEILPEPGKPRTPLAPELRTIQYTFATSHESSANNQQHPGGLVRREWPWETWAGFRDAGLSSTGTGSPVSLLPVNESEWNSEDTLALEKDRGLYHVPQVTGLEFRYFDGLKWEAEWDSWERRRLPKLVEVLLKINATRDEHETKVSEEASEDEEASLSLTEENTSGIASSSSTRRGRIYRRLINLPFSEEMSGSDGDGQGSPITGEMVDSVTPRSPMRSRQP